MPGRTARHWEPLSGGRVRCTVCPRRCVLAEGQRGFCFVRMCRDGALHLDTWGRSSGFCVDPIEKKPLNHFLPGTPVLSFGTAGCNLACRFCQNWEMSTARESDVLAAAASPEAIARAAADAGCRSVAYTYNDPTIFLEYAVDTAAACRERGVRSVAVTAGYIEGDARRELFDAMDAVNVDLKAFDPDFYRRLAGADIGPVLDTLRFLARETSVWLEVTTLLIPGENDSPREVEQLSRWVLEELGEDVPLHFSAFHPAFRLTHLPPTPPATLRRARAQARDCGLRHVYTGNIRDPEGDGTWCHACGALLIGRAWYEVSAWRLTEAGTCPDCGAPCAGVFEAWPGDWGGRRLPLRIDPAVP